MVQNLTPENFSPYGCLSGGGRTAIGNNNHSISLSPKSIWTYFASADTWLRNENGLSILSVSADGVHFQDFYLDKPVVIRDGIRFSLTALREPSSVQMAAVLVPTLEQTRPLGKGFTAYPGLQVRSIYTLFCQEKEEGFLFSGEAHEMAELIYVDEGCLHSVVEGVDTLLNRGDLVIYSPNQWHMQYADPGQAPRIINISFDAEQVDWAFLAGGKFTSQQAVFLLQQILREQERMEPYAQDMIFSLLTQLLLVLQREGRETPAPIQMPQNYHNENVIIRKAQQFVGENVFQKLSVPVLAQGIGVSASYLTALFHKHLQLAPAEYIRRAKLQKSKQLIREGKMSFTEIAQALQYSTIHHFSRQFKEKFGITPTEYARAMRN